MTEVVAVGSSPEAPRLSWVLPLFRTADQLHELIRRIHATSNALIDSYEIILVDDACPEGTGAIAETIAMTDTRVKVLRLDSNHGQDAALREGLQLSRGEWTLILDADLQDPPEAIHQVWPLRNSGADAIFVERTGAYSSAGRRLTSRMYRFAVARISRLPRGACLFVLLARSLVDRINAAGVDKQASLLALIAAAGTRFSSVPVVRSPRAVGVSGYSSFARCTKAARSLWQMFAAHRLNHRLGLSPQSSGKP